ncbi:hypothetical protein BGX38DRAFT_1235078 [Terfezia claveryi]|nr:hypothetical protein BGX38DRAFT_1235078 [Terfezia claveryi]
MICIMMESPHFLTYHCPGLNYHSIAKLLLFFEYLALLSLFLKDTKVGLLLSFIFIFIFLRCNPPSPRRTWFPVATSLTYSRAIPSVPVCF